MKTIYHQKINGSIFTLLLLLASLSDVIGQQSWTFNTSGSSGRFGPTQAQVDASYAGTSLETKVSITTQGIQEWTVPQTGTYSIQVFGAGGGDGTNSNNTIAGKGAMMSGRFDLDASDVLRIMVGQKGGDAQPTQSGCSINNRGAGGGGGTFVTDNLGTPLIVAGGGNGDSFSSWTTNGPDGQVSNTGTGAGASTSRGGGGGGLSGTATGIAGGAAFVDGGIGGERLACNKGDGGFGGGGGSRFEGGGGGGYTGGSVVINGNYTTPYPSYGAGSFNSGDSQSNLSGANTGDGYAIITLVIEAEISETGGISCNGSADGELTATAPGGTAPFSYSWSNGDTNPTTTGLSAGIYSVSITDNTGTVFTDTYTLTEPQAIQIDIDMTQSSTCEAIGDGALLAVAYDGAAPYSYSWSSGETTASIANKAIGTYTVTATDNDGCISAPFGKTITANDITTPTVLVKTAQKELDASGMAIIEVSDVDNGSYDDCDLQGLTVTDGSFNCALPGFVYTNVVTLLAEDVSGNKDSAQVSVTLSDTLSPVAKANDFTAELDAGGSVSVAAADLDNGSNDNCTLAQVFLSKTDYDCTELGANAVTFTAQDISGNQKAIVKEITVVDNLAPILSVQNVTLTLGASNSVSLNISDVEVSSSDNCGVASKVLSQTVFTCAAVGQNNTVTLTVKDGSDNAVSKTFNVSVLDAISPVISGQDFTLELDANGQAILDATLVKNLADAGSTDNCQMDENSYSLSQMSYDCSDIGVQVVTFSVADASTNESSQNISVTVVDNQAPTIVTYDLVAQLDEEGNAILDALNSDGGSFDNCGIQSRTLSETDFDCSDIGQQPITLTIADAAGNETSETFMLTVQDGVAPTGMFLADAKAYLNSSGNAVITAAAVLMTDDNCGVAQQTLNETAFDCSDVGSRNLSAIVEDAHGNISLIEGQVMVLDTIKPQFTLNEITLDIDAEGEAHITEAMLLPFASDNCEVLEVAVQISTFSCSNVQGETSTQVIVFDTHGNLFQSTLTVYLQDPESPSVVVAEYTAYLEADGTVSIEPEDLDMEASDNCGIASRILNKTSFSCSDLGSNNNGIIVSDFSGNEAFTGFTVNVIDTLSPVFTCQDTLIACSGPLTLSEPPVTDNCNFNLVKLSGPEDGDVLSTGNYEVQYMATDQTGNSSMCLQNIKVVQTPVVNLGPNLAVESGTIVTLSSDINAESYLWSTGQTSSTIEVTITTDMTITLEVTTSDGCTSTDIIFIDATDVLGVAVSELSAMVNLYPNPAKDNLTVNISEFEVLENVRLEIHDLQGRILHQRVLGNIQNEKKIELDVSAFEKAVYIVSLYGSEFQYFQRVVIQ